MFAKAHIYIKMVNITQLKLGLLSMSQLLYGAAYYCASKQQVLSNIFPPFLAGKME